MKIKKITCPKCGHEIDADLELGFTKSDSGRCAAKTKAGTQCKRLAVNGKYCWQHTTYTPVDNTPDFD